MVFHRFSLEIIFAALMPSIHLANPTKFQNGDNLFSRLTDFLVILGLLKVSDHTISVCVIHSFCVCVSDCLKLGLEREEKVTKTF